MGMLQNIKRDLVLAISALYTMPALAEGNAIVNKVLGNQQGETLEEMVGDNGTIARIGGLVITGITGVATIYLVIQLILKALKLSSSGDNPSERQRAIQGLITLFIGAAICGSATFFLGIAFGLFAKS